MSSPFAYLPHRAVLSLSGPDTIALLERLVTHRTKDWPPGETRYGALLTPQGKVIADWLALRTAEGVLLDVDREVLPDLAKRLKLFRLRAKVEIEVREDLFVIAGLDPAPEGVRPISGALQVYLDPRYIGGRLRGLATQESWAAWYGDHPAEWSRPLPDYHGDRISNCVPEQGSDFASAAIFPADINMDRFGGVDLKKGCFVGQEVVSRMHRRGKIRKRVISLSYPQRPPPIPGSPLMATHAIGEVLSANSAGALALVRIDRLASAEAAGQDICLDETPVTIEKPDWLQGEMAALEADG